MSDIWYFLVPNSTDFADETAGYGLGDTRRTNGICDFLQEKFVMRKGECRKENMASRNKFEVVNGNVHIFRDGWEKVAEVTYREDYYEELTSVTWTKNNGYIKNSKLGSLHRYMVEKWYGKEILQEMTEQGWVVDHMNNNGFDCRICNLEFLLSRHNVAKGQRLDVESKEMWKNIALNLYKDFTTGFYQIAIGFNDDIYFMDTKEVNL